MFRRWAIVLGVLDMLVVATASALGAARYTVTDLGTLTAPYNSGSWAYAVDNSGDIVGDAWNGNGFGYSHAFLYHNGAMTDLGTLGGSYCHAYDINNSGQITGWTTTSGGYVRPYLFSNGAMQDLGALPGNASQGKAIAINDCGEVVGYYAWNDSGTQSKAFLYSGGTIKDIGGLGGTFTYAREINVNGQVVGQSTNSTGAKRAFIYEDGSMTDLGILPGYTRSIAGGINTSGQVVGESSSDSYSYLPNQRAFLWTNGNMVSLGGLPAYPHTSAVAINDSGDVVGDAHDAYTNFHAFLFSNGTLSDLNDLIDPTSGWTVQRTGGINNAGQIVGMGINSLGQTHAFLLTPINTPEPSTLVLLGVGAVGVLGWAWRKKCFRKNAG
jgi:probable HAF family extracellular repeat protein